jgi:hypothetical protein
MQRSLVIHIGLPGRSITHGLRTVAAGMRPPAGGGRSLGSSPLTSGVLRMEGVARPRLSGWHRLLLGGALECP